MKDKLFRVGAVLLAASVLLSAAGWFWLIKPALTTYFAGSESPFIKAVVGVFYPRLATEQLRFPSSFFIEKAGQVLFRFNWVLAAAVGALFLQTRKNAALRIKTWWEAPVSVRKTGLAVRLFFGLLLFFRCYNLPDLLDRCLLSAFYSPLLPLRLLSLPAPSEELI